MDKNISRRDFLKASGAVTLAAATGCSGPSKGQDGKAGSGPAIEGDGEMEYRTNPGDGDKVSLLGYGCMRWPMIKDRNGKDVVDQEKVNELIDHAMANGVNYYDTSPAYLRGQSERASGIALSRYPRKSYYIATKLSNFNDASKDASIKMYHDSFEQMETDYFDYYLLHAIGQGGKDAFHARYVDNGLIDFLLKEREAGRIRQLGFSFHGVQDTFDYFLTLHSKYHWDFIQIQMNYVDWNHADQGRNVNASYLYDQIDKLEIPITVMEPLQGGRLASVPDNVANMLLERNPRASIASWAFRFAGSFPRILTALSGMTYMEHLVDNLKSFKGFVPLTEEDKEFLEKMAVLMKEYPTVDCNDCKYCMPCPYGLDIPGIFKHYNGWVNTGDMPQGPEQEEFRKLRRKYLISYDRAIESLRQADHCVGCRQCVPHCPQSIDIPGQLHRIDRYVEKLRREG